MVRREYIFASIRYMFRIFSLNTLGHCYACPRSEFLLRKQKTFFHLSISLYYFLLGLEWLLMKRCDTVPAPGTSQAFDPYSHHVFAWNCSTVSSILLPVSLSGEYTSSITWSYPCLNKWNRCGSQEWGLEVAMRMGRMRNRPSAWSLWPWERI